MQITGNRSTNICSQKDQRDADSMLLTIWVSSRTTIGAVSPLPYFSQALFVAILKILEARTGPKVGSQSEQTARAPDRMSPNPPHLLFPPAVRTINDCLLPKIKSSLPLMKSVKLLNFSMPGNSCTSSWLSYLASSYSTSISMNFLRKVSYLALGVITALNRFNSGSSYGCWHRKQMPSASKTVSDPSGRFLTNIGKNSFIYRSLPNPGPIIHELIADFHVNIFSIHSSCRAFTSWGESLTSSSETNKGCTIISGEYDLIAEAALLEQKI